MKKVFTIIFAALFLVSFVSIAFAQKLNSVHIDDTVSRGNFIELHTNIHNENNNTLKRSKIVFWVPDADIRESTNTFEIPQKSNYGRMQHIYVYSTQPVGTYDARVSFFSNGKMRHVWREIEIDNSNSCN